MLRYFVVRKPISSFYIHPKCQKKLSSLAVVLPDYLRRHSWQKQAGKCRFLKSMICQEAGPGAWKKRVSLLIWAPAGTGCPMYLTASSRSLEKKFLILWTDSSWSIIPCLLGWWPNRYSCFLWGTSSSLWKAGAGISNEAGLIHGRSGLQI